MKNNDDDDDDGNFDNSEIYETENPKLLFSYAKNIWVSQTTPKENIMSTLMMRDINVH